MTSPYETKFTVTQAAHNALKEEINGLNIVRKRQSAEIKRLNEQVKMYIEIAMAANERNLS